jgi:hypothetical protein
MNEAFLRDSGLDDVPKSKRIGALAKMVAFVLAMRDTYDKARNALPEAKDDERLVALAASRLRLPEPIRHGMMSIESVIPKATALISQLAGSTPEWPSLPVSDKFRLLCAVIMDMEFKMFWRRPPPDIEDIVSTATLQVTGVIVRAVLATEPLEPIRSEMERQYSAHGSDTAATGSGATEYTPEPLTPDGWLQLQHRLTPADVSTIRDDRLPVYTPTWLAAGPLADVMNAHVSCATELLKNIGMEVPIQHRLGLHSFGAYCTFAHAESGNFRVQQGRREQIVADLRNGLACTACLQARGVPTDTGILEDEAEEVEAAMDRIEEAMTDLVKMRRPESDTAAMLRLGEILGELLLGRGNVMSDMTLSLYTLRTHNTNYEVWAQENWGFIIEDGLAPPDSFKPYQRRRDALGEPSTGRTFGC